MSEPSPPLRYGVVVPVKHPDVAKSRLQGLGDERRRSLVVAFAVDTVTAALACPLVGAVLAVTDDDVLADDLAAAGAAVIPDRVSGDLNGTLVLAAAELHRRDATLGIAALCADLPALRADELAAVLARAPRDRMSFVADSDGRGTTIVASPDTAGFRPSFGEGSRAAHLDAGAREIDGSDVPSVRRDVDTPDDLRAALALGVGARTMLAAAGLRI